MSRLLRRLLHRLTALVLVLAFLPGTHELAEAAEHLLHDGHLPHSSVHRDQDAPEPGHDRPTDCAALTCACHLPVPGVPVIAGTAVPPPGPAADRPELPGVPAPDHPAQAPPTPPPIA